MKNIIVTGTSRGIGLELVKELAQKGHQIIAISRNILPTQALHLPNVHSLQVDLSNEEDFDKITDFLHQKNWKKVDILINNAGKLINKPFEKLSYKDFLDVYQVNIFGVVKLTQLVLPFMEKNANVLNISSMGGVQGSVKFAGLAAYSSSKGALITLTELLAEEFKEKSIHFNVLALGAVQTEMLQEAFPDYQASVSPCQVADYIADFVLNRAHLFNGKIIQVANSTP